MPWSAAPVLGVSNVTASVGHWCEVLGFQLAGPVFMGVGDEEEGGVYAIVQRGGCEVHLQIRRQDLQDPERPRDRSDTDVYLRIDDVEAFHDEISARSAQAWGPPARAPYGILEIRVTTPDGHRITFGERVAS